MLGLRNSQTLLGACLCECLGQSGGFATEEKVDLLIAVTVVELSVVACAVGFYSVNEYFQTAYSVLFQIMIELIDLIIQK